MLVGTRGVLVLAFFSVGLIALLIAFPITLLIHLLIQFSHTRNPTVVLLLAFADQAEPLPHCPLFAGELAPFSASSAALANLASTVLTHFRITLLALLFSLLPPLPLLLLRPCYRAYLPGVVKKKSKEEN